MASNSDDAAKHIEARFYDIAQEPLKVLEPIASYTQIVVVPLETAVKPLISFLPEIETYASTAKQKCENPADGLTQDESASIMLYTMIWQPHEQCLYFALNSVLRLEDRQKLKPWLLYLKLIFTALSRLPSTHLTVYRGIKVDLSKEYSLRKTFTWWSFPLCTLSLDVLQSDEYLGKTGTRTMFIIECHSGKDIQQHSYFPREDQVLLLAASQFKVIASGNSGDDLYTIQLKEIEATLSSSQPVNVSDSPMILSASRLMSMPSPSVPSKLISQSMTKYIDHTLKLQTKIEKYQTHSWVDLVNEDLDDRDIPVVIQHALIKKRCTILRLDNNKITSQGISVLANALRSNTTLTGLNLYSNRIHDIGVHFLVKFLSVNNSALEKLHLGSNGITDEGAEYLAEMLKTNKTLTVLWLNNNDIGDLGVQLLADALAHQNTRLQELSLRDNKLITSTIVDFLIYMMIHNRSLTKLDVSNCNLTAEDNLRLRQASIEKEHFTLRSDTQENDCEDLQNTLAFH